MRITETGWCKPIFGQDDDEQVSGNIIPHHYRVD